MESDMRTSEIAVRRLQASDAELYRAIRLELLRLNPEAYGSALETEETWSLGAFAERLEQAHLLGGFTGHELLGIAGFLQEEGSSVGTKDICGAFTCDRPQGARELPARFAKA